MQRAPFERATGESEVNVFEKEFEAGQASIRHPEILWCLDLTNQIEQLAEELPGNGCDPEIRRPIHFLLCLFRDLESGEINYDASEGSGILISGRHALLEALRNVRARLARLDEDESLARSVYVRQLAAGARNSIVAESSLRRELLFIVSQAASLPRVVRLKQACA